MRVIAGSARRLPLKAVPGLSTRPTTDRIKETLFNILQDRMPDCRFLDLFSGSGAIAIEALSRGAKKAVLVESDRRAVECIRGNLAFTRLADRACVLACDVFEAIGRLEAEGKPFDFIFMDPPYGQELERRVLERLSGSCLIDDGGAVIVESDLDTDFSYVGELGFFASRFKTYKTNQHVFLKKEEPYL